METITKEQLKYFTTAAWLRGYAFKLKEEQYSEDDLIKNLKLAANLLDYVWTYGMKTEGEEE
jgi:hypothetical protein